MLRNIRADCRFLLGLAIPLLLAGCAAEPRQFVLLGQAAANAERLTWPPIGQGEVPRYNYVGELVGDPNYVTEKREPGVSMTNLARLIRAIVVGREEPKELSRTQSGVVDAAGRVLVTDFGRQSVVVFDSAARGVDEWRNATASRQFMAPVGIAVAEDGNVFVADADLAVVVRLDSSGKPLSLIGEGQLGRPTGLAYDPATKRLFVTDTPAHQVKVFGLDGKLLDAWGEQGGETDRAKGRGSGEDLLLNWPTHLTVARGKLYIADSMNARVMVVAADSGKPLATIGTRGNFVGNLVRPKGVAVDSEGNVYVIESFHDRMLVFNSKGQFLMAIGGEGGAPGEFVLPSGIWIDRRDRIFVADTHNARVQIFQFLGGGVESTE
jgi:DNA-binding beta-propeller fold protein YncE